MHSIINNTVTVCALLRKRKDIKQFCEYQDLTYLTNCITEYIIYKIYVYVRHTRLECWLSKCHLEPQWPDGQSLNFRLSSIMLHSDLGQDTLLSQCLSPPGCTVFSPGHGLAEFPQKIEMARQKPSKLRVNRTFQCLWVV